IVQRKDVRMLEPGRDLDLAQESLGAEDGRDVVAEHLEGDESSVFDVAGKKDGSHTAATELALDDVAVADSLAQGLPKICHARLPAPARTYPSVRPRRRGAIKLPPVGRRGRGLRLRTVDGARSGNIPWHVGSQAKSSCPGMDH